MKETFNPMAMSVEYASKPALWIALLIGAALGGCGSGKREVTGDVAGKVTLDGAPVTSGSISFISKDGKAGAAPLDGAGAYSMPKVVVGRYKVVVVPPELPPPGAPGSSKQKGMADFPGHPKKYRSDLTTDLEAEVKEGDNHHNFDLKPQSIARKK